MAVKWQTVCTTLGRHHYHFSEGYHSKCPECGGIETSGHIKVESSIKIFHEWQCPRCGRWNSDKGSTECQCGKYDRSGCFITTATTLSLGKGDRCEELQTSREFRDTYLKDRYPELIEQYYQIAPDIVDAINALPEKEFIYKDIWERYLSTCLLLMRSKKFEETVTLYKQMVTELQRKYLFQIS